MRKFAKLLKIAHRRVIRTWQLFQLKRDFESREQIRLRLRGTAIPQLSVGRGSYINEATLFCWDSRFELSIGRYCSLAAGITFIGGGEHDVDWVSTYPFIDRWNLDELKHLKKRRYEGPIHIGSDVWIGGNTTILSGVTIGDGAIVAAGAVVKGDVAPFTIVGGVPAKQIRHRFEPEIANALQSMAWWNWDQTRIKENAGLMHDPAAFISAHMNGDS